MKVYFILCLTFNYKLKQAFGNGDEVKVEPINSRMVIVHYDNAIDYKNVLELNEVWLLDSFNNTVAKALREGNESSLLTQKLNKDGTLRAELDPCSCQKLRIKYFYINKWNKRTSSLFGFDQSPMNYFNDNPNELVCVSPENQPIFNNYPNQAWIPDCVSKIRINSFSPRDFQGNGSVDLLIENCSKNFTKINFFQLQECNAGFSTKMVAAIQSGATWALIAIFTLILGILSF